MPEFGFSEKAPARPAAWPDAPEPDYYFVDNTSDAATDTGNPYGSPSKPRLSIPGGPLAAGSYVEIHGGPYGPDKPLPLIVNGSIESPVWVRGPNESNKPVIRLPIKVSGSYAIFENLYFDRNRTAIGIEPGSHHIAVRNNEFSGDGSNVGFTSVLGAYGNPGTETRDIVFLDNTIRDFGDISPGAPENDYHGIKTSRYCSDVWIVRNRIFNMGGDSIQVGDSTLEPKERCRRVFISQNEFYANRENGVDIKSAEKIIVSGNILRDFSPPRSSDAIAIVVHDGADSVWIIDNHLENNSIGVVNTFGTDTWIISNTIAHSITSMEPDPTSFYGGGVAIHFRGASSGGALLNLLRNYQKGIQVAGGLEYLIAGNQFLVGEFAPFFDIMLKTTWLTERVTMTHNEFNDFSARVSSSDYARRSQVFGQSRKEYRASLEFSRELIRAVCDPDAESNLAIPQAVLPASVTESFRSDFDTDLGAGLAMPGNSHLLGHRQPLCASAGD